MTRKIEKYTTSFLLLGIFVYTVFSYFVLSLTSQLNQNEQMYLSASVLVQNGLKLYSDFIFLQMPYLPHLYATLFAISPLEYLLLQAKIVSVLATLGSAFPLFYLVYRNTEDFNVGLAFACGYLINFHVFYISHEISNYALPLFFSNLSFLLLMLFLQSPAKRRCLFFSGVFASVAVGLKLYYVFLVIPQYIALMNDRSARNFVVLGMGHLIGALPILMYLVADFQLFYFNNVACHRIITEYRELSNFFERNYWKIYGLIRWLTRPNNLATIFIFFISLFIVKREKFKEKEVYVPFLFLFFFIVAIFQIDTIFYQYLPSVFAFVFFILASLFFRITTKNKQRFLVSFVIFLFLSSPVLMYPITIVSGNGPRFFEPLTLHSDSRMIKQIAGFEKGGKLATLRPDYAVETGIHIYPELAIGPFAYQVGHLIEKKIDYENRLVYVSRDNIGRMFDQNPPRAILIASQDLEKALYEYALENGYQKVSGIFRNKYLMLFVRPDVQLRLEAPEPEK